MKRVQSTGFLPISQVWQSLRYRMREVSWARSLKYWLRAPRDRPALERNIWYLYVEVFWAAIFSAVFSFNATYALRLGATNQMVGWLSSLPSLFAMFMMIPAARFLETKTDRAPWINATLFIGRLGFLAAAFIPWLFPHRAAQVIIWLLVLRTLPITFFNTGFGPMMADIIPPRDRARVFSNRSIISSGTAAAASFLAGKWLDAASTWSWAAFPFNYQLLYIVGGLGALISAYLVSKVKAPPSKVLVKAPATKRERLTWSRFRTTVQAMASERRDFVRITMNTLVFNLGAWLVGPLYIIFFVRQLEAPDSWIGLNTTLANLGVIAGYALWRRWVNKLGDGRALRLTVPLSASYAFLVAFFPNLTMILVWGILINLINPGVNLSHTNVFYSLCPEDRRASYMAVYSTLMNVGAFICPMIGVAMSETMDIRWVLLIGGVVRLLGGLMFYLWPVETAPETPEPAVAKA